MNNRLFRASAALLAVLSVVACHRRPLYDLNEQVKLIVEVDTDNIKNITSDIYNPAIPVPDLTTDMLRAMIYDPDTDKLLTQAFVSEKTVNERGHQVLSTTLDLGVGNFDFLVYNFDTPNTLITGEDNQTTIKAYTEGVPVTDIENLSVVEEPDHLFVARVPDVRLVMSDELKVVEATAYPIIDTYYLQIPVEGLKNVSTASVVLSGLSPSNTFGPNVHTNSNSGVFVDLIKSTDPKLEGDNKDVLCCIFSTFGKLDSFSSDAFFTANVADGRGTVHQLTINLDEVFKSANAIDHHWLLLDDIWVIPDPDVPGTSDGGFQPEVIDWETEEGGIAL